ncbi:hypothetical protein Tco_0308752, partial [Tanacetum coccineum]
MLFFNIIRKGVLHDALRALVDMLLVAMLIEDVPLVVMMNTYTLSHVITAVRQAQLVDTDTESNPKEDPLEAEESQPLGSRVPLMSEDFEASKPSGTRTISSHSSVSSDSTAPLLPDHPLTHASPTPTPARVSFHHRIACMVVRTQPTLSLGMSARIAKAATLSPSSFLRKRYRGTSELILDTDSKGDEDTEEDDEDENDEGQGSKDEGPGMEEEEAAPEGQQQA